MAVEWSAAALAAGAVGSLTTGVWVLVQGSAAAQRMRRKVNHQQVRVSLLGQEEVRRYLRMIPILIGAVVTYMVVAILTRASVLAFATAIGVFMVPGWLSEYRETRRLLQLGDQLNQVMSMVSTSLRRGTPLEAAIAEAANALSYPLKGVLQNLAEATSMGVTLTQAVEQVRLRPEVRGSTDFQVFATEMVICHERGANIIQAFDALRQVLAARRRYRDQVREHMGQHLMQSLVIFAIGLGVLFFYVAMTEWGIRPLLDVWWGQLVLAISLLGNTFLIRWTHMVMLRQIKKV